MQQHDLHARTYQSLIFSRRTSFEETVELLAPRAFIHFVIFFFFWLGRRLAKRFTALNSDVSHTIRCRVRAASF